MQKKSEDYDQTFSLATKLGTIRALLSTAASKKLILTQFDVCTSFLYEKIKEDIFMRQPEGYQAPRCCNKRFVNLFILQGFTETEEDSCVILRLP